jgi:long-chain acyl-CoA synthetase
MRRLLPPSTDFKGRVWSADELAGLAAGWLDAIPDRTRSAPGLTAMVLGNHPEAVALFFALSSLPGVIVALSPDPRTWRSAPPFPPRMALFLPPAFRHLTSAAAAAGLTPHVVPDGPRRAPGGVAPPFLACSGVVTFTSGSTGFPKPVCVSTRSFLAQASAIADAYGLPQGCGVIGSLPLASHYGVGHALILPTVLGARLGLLSHFDHRAVLALFASGDYRYWAGTPFMADLLTRAAVSGPAPAAPPVCHMSAAPLSEPVFSRFRERFGAPLRPSYGKTESGFITAETAEASAVRPDAVGRPVRGVLLSIGDEPQEPFRPGRIGRVWFRSPWCMEGYGFPPHLAPAAKVDGWSATEDMGTLDEAGYLILAGRSDDCFKTAAGHLVNPAEIVRALTGHPGVTDAIIVPVPTGRGPAIGALVQADGALEPGEVRATAARTLPVWLQPELVLVTEELPRLPGGKVDRRATVAILKDASGADARS